MRFRRASSDKASMRLDSGEASGEDSALSAAPWGLPDEYAAHLVRAGPARESQPEHVALLERESRVQGFEEVCDALLIAGLRGERG